MACSQSDAGITTAIKGQLAADDEVKAYQIDVVTNDRIVTLSGTVVQLAQDTSGVREAIDRLTIAPR